jgi:tRNA threonylcarbamoyladenosine biosynthesis protein TsaE
LRSGIHDQAAIEAAGAWIAGRLRPGDSVLLSGPLGAGKSTLARALIRAVCGNPFLEVPSPTYTLMQSFAANSLVVHHFDLWRLDGPDGLVELGWDDALQDVVVVEWPERLGHLRPTGALDIELGLAGPDTRRLTCHGWPDRLPR